MIAADHHIIHKQYLEIDFSNKEGSSKVHERARSWYYDDVVPVLEETMNAMAPSGQYIFIKDLQIDLGNVSLFKSAHFKRDAIEKVLKEAIQRKLDEVQPGADVETFDHDDVFAPQDESGISIISKELATFKALLIYLEKGVIPIWFKYNSVSHLEKEVMKYDKAASNNIKRLLKLGQTKKYVAKRLIYQFSTSFIKFLIERNPQSNKLFKHSVLEKLYDHLDNNSKSYSPKITKSLKIRILGYTLFSEQPVGNDPQVLEQLFEAIRPEDERKVVEILQELKTTLKSQDSTALNLITQVIEKQLRPKNQSYESRDQEEESTLGVKSDEESETIKKPNKDLTQKSDLKSDELQEITETIHITQPDEVGPEIVADQIVKDDEPVISGSGLYVNNSGLVLLSPYLEMFFAEIGFVSKKQFIDDEAKQRAVNVLHYLVHGLQPATENDYILNKIICNLEIHEPVECNLEMTSKEKQESEDLLNAMIRNWSALKKTSPDGLREGFLRREGVIEQNADGWKLTVEQKSLDVLLSSIPWGFNVLKLPWMEQPVFVKWT